MSAFNNNGTVAGNINVAQGLTITGGTSGTLGTLTGYNGTIGTITANNLTFDSGAHQLLDDNIVVNSGTGTVTNNGALQVNAPHSITGNYNQSAGATLVVGVTDLTHYGQLIISGAATMTNGQVLITPTSGALSNGETFTIVQALAAGTNYSGVTATANGFTVTASSITNGSDEDLILALSGGTVTPPPGGNSGSGTSTYEQLGRTYSGADGGAIGTALDQIQTQISKGSNTGLTPILTALNMVGVQQGSAAEGVAIKQLAPGQLGSSASANNLTAAQSMLVVGQHQQNLRSQNTGSTVGHAAGSEYASGAFWMQVDGGFANNSTSGDAYHQSYYGITFGADDHITKNALLGMAVGWSHNTAQGDNALSGNNVTTSTPEIMGYGTYRMGPAYIDGMLGVGYNMFTQSRRIGFLNSVASSNYAGMQYMGNVESGWDFHVSPRTTATPLIGFNAVRSDTNGYMESGAGASDTSVGHQTIDSYATLLGGRFTTTLPSLWGALTPEVKLAWAHDLNNSPISTNASLGGVGFATTTPRTSPDGAEVSLATTLQRTDALSLRLEYDGDLRSDFQSHTGLLKGEWKF